MPLVLGVDSSTSACKVELRDADSGELVAAGRAPHPETHPPRSEQDPAAWWLAFSQACAIAGLGERGRRPDAVAVAGQQHGMVVLGADGHPLRPAKLWNDTESALDAASLVADLGGAAAWADACGSVPVPSFTVTKLRWLLRCEPEIFDRVRTVLLPHDWLTLQLTGTCTTDRGDGSGTGYWSAAEERYRFDLLALVDDRRDWEDMVPRVLGPAEVAGTWAVHDAVVAPGTGDNMAAALGLGLRPGDLAISLGTSGTAFAVSEQATHDPSGAVAGFADATGRFLPLVCTLNATKATDAIARLLGVDHARFDEFALEAPPGAGGVAFVPYLDGERTPNLPDATGRLVGLRGDVTPELVARAAVEGVVCNLLAAAESLPTAGIGTSESTATGGRVFLVGGGSRSAAYRRVVADLLERPVIVPLAEELVALGAAAQAAATLSGRSWEALAADWSLGAGTTTEPGTHGDAVVVRKAWAAAADEVAQRA